MKDTKTKLYTLTQAGKFLGFSGRSIRDFVKVGLIRAFPNPTWMVVTEDELKRIMLEGLDTSGVTAALAAMRKAAAKKAVAKKRGRGGAVAVADKKAVAKKRGKGGVTAARKVTTRKRS